MQLDARWTTLRETIHEQAVEFDFEMSSLAETGKFLAALAASKRNGRVLELGTGLGFGATWLLQGMSHDSTLVSVENDTDLVNKARENLGFDARVNCVHEDAGEYLLRESENESRFDLIFADAWPGKFSHLEEALQLVDPGGFYVVDDLLPQPTWPEGHGAKVEKFIENITSDNRFSWIHIEWASGILLGARTR